MAKLMSSMLKLVESEKEIEGSGNIKTYGIKFCAEDGKCRVFDDISVDKGCVEELIKRIEQNSVSEKHICDVINDFICEKATL